MEVFQKAAVCLVALTATVWDLRSKKIPNLLITIGLLGGAIFQIVRLGVRGSVFFLGSALLPVLVLAVLYYFRMIGAGDVKLLAVLGGFLGPMDFCVCLIWALFFGGVLSLGLMIARGNLGKRFWYLAGYLKAYLEIGEWQPYRQEDGKDGEFPFTVPILLSVLCYAGGIF